MILSEITQTHSDLTIDLKQILQLPQPRPHSETLHNSKCCSRGRAASPLLYSSTILKVIAETLTDVLSSPKPVFPPVKAQPDCVQAAVPRKGAPESCACQFGRSPEAV